MKYEIIVEKINENQYMAFSSLITNLRVTGENFDSTLDKLQQEFLCFLHDSDAEMEILVENCSEYKRCARQISEKSHISTDF